MQSKWQEMSDVLMCQLGFILAVVESNPVTATQDVSVPWFTSQQPIFQKVSNKKAKRNLN